jgi:hypothetical protein
MDLKSRRVSIHQEEMETILNLKSAIDYQEALSSYAEKYRNVGWSLEALKAQDGTGSDLDFPAHADTWDNRRWEAELGETKTNLGVRTGKESRLLVLEVAMGDGEAILDQYGPWRAECIAALGDGRQQHFYAWDSSLLFDEVPLWSIPAIKWYGEGQVAPLPPSSDPETMEDWRWLCPPWETPPKSPSQPLLVFLQQHLNREPQTLVEVCLSWQEVYCLVSPHEALLEALSAFYPSMRNYYEGIIQAAAGVGINAPEVLLSLLWHAPRGNARQHPEIWDDLRKSVAQVQGQPEVTAAPGNIPWKLFLDNAFASAREPAVRKGGQPPNKARPSGFHRRPQGKLPQTGSATRSPFSCTQNRDDFRKT